MYCKRILQENRGDRWELRPADAGRILEIPQSRLLGIKHYAETYFSRFLSMAWESAFQGEKQEEASA
jgi:hypothetical protein